MSRIMNIYEYKALQCYYTGIEDTLDKNFGCTDYMEANYNLLDKFYDGEPKVDFSIIKVWEVATSEPTKLPRYVVETLYGQDGDMLIFESSIHLIEYLNSIMPFLRFMSERK